MAFPNGFPSATTGFWPRIVLVGGSTRIPKVQQLIKARHDGHDE
jgi:hypothetical protein